MPATQVVVAVSIDAPLSDSIMQVKADIYEIGGSDPSDQRSYQLTPSESDKGVKAPFSFGIVKAGGDRFLLVVTGYEAGTREAVIEQKLIVAFQTGKTLLVPVHLSAACFNRPCRGLDQTCASNSGQCAEVPLAAGLRSITPGDELGGLSMTTGQTTPGVEAQNGKNDSGGTDAGTTSGLDGAVATPMDGAVATPMDAAVSKPADGATTTTEAGLPTSTCIAGQYVLSGSTPMDRVCAGCASGTFSTQENAAVCTAWRTCEPGKYVANMPSELVDRDCMPCETGTSTLSPNQSTCLPPGSCQAGRVETMPATSSTAAVCRTCMAGEYCAGGSAAALRCDDNAWDHDGSPASACTPRTICLPGQSITSAGSATTNRTCGPCAPGSFSTQNNAAMCALWTPCPTDYVESVAGTNRSDRLCVLGMGWTRQFGTGKTDRIFGLALDGASNVIAAGETYAAFAGYTNVGGQSDCFVRKYTSAGVDLWTRQFGTSLHDRVNATAVDGTGNVYVAGETEGVLQGTSSGSYDAFIRKFSSTGGDVWTLQFGTDGFDRITSMAVDGSGNVIVAGQVNGALMGQTHFGSYDAFVRKYNGAGVEQWTRQFESAEYEAIDAMNVDANGNVYVVGQTYAALLTNQTTRLTNAGASDVFLRKYNSAGTEAWTREFGSNADDFALGVGVDNSSNVYVIGYTFGALPGQTTAGSLDAFVRKFTSTGADLWTTQFGGPGADYVKAGSVDRAGNVVVAGFTTGGVAGLPSAGQADGYLLKYNASGTRTGAKMFGGDMSEEVYGLAVDASGTVYVGGFTNGIVPPATTSLGDTDAVLIKTGL